MYNERDFQTCRKKITMLVDMLLKSITKTPKTVAVEKAVYVLEFSKTISCCRIEIINAWAKYQLINLDQKKTRAFR